MLLFNMSSCHDHSGIVSKMYKGTIFFLSCTSQLRKEMNCVGVSLGFAFEQGECINLLVCSVAVVWILLPNLYMGVVSFMWSLEYHSMLWTFCLKLCPTFTTLICVVIERHRATFQFYSKVTLFFNLYWKFCVLFDIALRQKIIELILPIFCFLSTSVEILS